MDDGKITKNQEVVVTTSLLQKTIRTATKMNNLFF